MKISLTIVRIFSKIYFQKAKPRNLKFFISTNSVVGTSRKSPLSIITRVNSFSHPINRVSVPSGNVTKTTEKQRRNGGNGVYPHPIYIRGKKRRGLEEEYSKPAYESRPNKNSSLLLLLLLKRTILRREYRYQRKAGTSSLTFTIPPPPPPPA